MKRKGNNKSSLSPFFRVSAIVSAYNSEKFIRGCLEDLVNQTLFKKDKLQIVVVDSGSAQNERAVVEEFQKRYGNIQYIRTDKRESIYAAWNRGIKAAKGKYITNANTDDRHRRDALEVMADRLDRNQDIGLVYGDQIITETANETFDRHTPVGNYRWIDYNRELLTLGCFIGPQPMWRKSLHDVYGYFDETFTVSGDWEFWLRMAEGTKMLHIRENLGLYYRSPQSAEHRDARQRVGEDNRIVQTYVSRYLASVGDIERGLEFINETERLAGSGAFAHLREELLELKKALLMNKGAAQLMPEKTASTHPSSAKPAGVNSLVLADELNQKGQVDYAVAALLNAIRQSPRDKRLHDALVDILIENKRYRDGLDILNNMPEEMRKNQKRYEQLASCANGLEQYERAEQYANDALNLNSNSAAAWNIKGFVAFKKGNRTEAENLFRRAIESDKDFGEACCNLAGIRWLAGDKEEAVALFEKAFILSPSVPDVALSYYTIAANLKQFARAADLFREATAMYPLNKKLKFTLIDILLQQNKFAEAMKETEEAMATFGIDDATLSLALGIREKIGAVRVGKKETDGDTMETGKAEIQTARSPRSARNDRKEPTLSLCIIVKNEEQNIARCLMSVKPVVDEMIVVDTGSTDRTRDIAKAFGAQVYDFAWTDSFADARNFSLSKASGDWILVLDADEVISPVDHEKLRSLPAYSIETDRDSSRFMDDKEKGVIARSEATRQSPVPNLNGSPNVNQSQSISGPRSKPVAYSFITRNYQNPIRLGWVANDGRYPKEESGTGWVPSVKVRLFPNKQGVRFENPVHEFVESSLSALGIEVMPCDIPVHHYGKLNEARTASQAEYYYGLGKRKLAEKGDSDIQALYEIAVQATELEKYEEALRYWEKVCEMKPDFADAFLMLADTYSSLGRYEEAASTAKKAMSLDPNSREIGASYAKYEIFRGHPEAAIEELKGLIETDRSYPKALAFLAAAYLIAGEKREGLSYLGLLNKTGFHASDFLTDFAKKLITAHKPDYAISLLQAALEHHYETDETRGLMEKAETDRDKIETRGDSVSQSPVSSLNESPSVSHLNVSPSLNKSQFVSVSLCMIVKNEEKNIVRCLESVKPVVDEMIVVDTGSTDRTKDIAKTFGAKVYDFPWTDSFADARNFAISKATGSWILILDADEVISPVDHEKLRLLVKARDENGDKIETRRDTVGTLSPSLNLSQSVSINLNQSRPVPVAYSFTTRNYVDQMNTIEWTANDGSYMKEEAGTGWFPGDKVRLFPRDERVRFEFPVHERIEPSLVRAGIKIQRCAIPVHHYGKLDIKKSTERAELYFELGKKRLAEQGGQDIMAMYDLAVQASEIRRYEEALEYLRKVIQAKPEFARAYLSMGNAYFNMQKYEDAAAAYGKAAELDPDLRDAFLLGGTCLVYAGKAENAILVLKDLLRRSPSYLMAVPPLTVARICAGQKDAIAEYLRNSGASNAAAAQYMNSFAKALMSSGRIPYAVSLFLAARENNLATEETSRLLDECYKMSEEK